MEEFKVGCRVVTQYKALPNREGEIVEIISGRVAKIESDNGDISHHKLKLLKIAGGSTNDN